MMFILTGIFWFFAILFALYTILISFAECMKGLAAGINWMADRLDERKAKKNEKK